MMRPESNLAIVAHYGSINNLLNMEPFERSVRESFQKAGWCRNSSNLVAASGDCQWWLRKKSCVHGVECTQIRLGLP